MSRTYRRKSAIYNLSWVLREDVWGGRPVVIDPRSKKGKGLLAKYYSDAGCGRYFESTPPHWYRRYMNHRADRREEMRLHQWLKKPCSELVFLPRVKDAKNYL